MSNELPIRILEKDDNKRGDLFCRLMSDLFFALGYDNFRFNIQKVGREMDLKAVHRKEQRLVFAECKATERRIGGDDINKFFGALDVERKLNDKDIVGYFVSLSGFTQTAIEQEQEIGANRVILLDGKQVIEELVKGKIIAPFEKVAERSGRCASELNNSIMDWCCELLAHESGWIWVVYYSINKQRTHFALIHADGTALSSLMAEKIVSADRSVGGDLHLLNYLSPEATIPQEKLEKAKNKYFAYLNKECGEITLEGLPADQEIGSRRLNLEHIFVPLYLQDYENDLLFETIRDNEKEPVLPHRILVGKAFEKCSRLEETMDKIDISIDEHEWFRILGDRLVPLLYSETLQVTFAACWAFAWLGECQLWGPQNNPSILTRLLELWKSVKSTQFKFVSAWAIAELPIIEQENNLFPKANQLLIKRPKEISATKEFIGEFDEYKQEVILKAYFVLGYYLKKPWTQTELSLMAQLTKNGSRQWANGLYILQKLNAK